MLNSPLFVGVITAFAGGLVSFWLKRISDKIDEREKERKEDEAKQQELEKARAEKIEKIERMLRALGRDRLMQGRRYFKRIAYIPPQEYENLSELFLAYEDIGGNDVGHKAFEEIKNLPFEPPKPESAE